MKKAIVTGSTGLLGMAVSKHLASMNIEVLSVGRKQLTESEIKKKFGNKITYISLPMENICNLNKTISKKKWEPGNDCVFYNFAWSGVNSLTDGTLQDQLNNAIYAEKAVKASKQIGCVKFVNSGTMEETFAEQHLKDKKNTPLSSSQTNYTIAKLAARDICKISSYLEKIDYVHTRLSMPLVPDLSIGTYVAKTLKNILKGKNFEPPTNNRLFDIIFVDDVAQAYYLIGNYGKNKANYFIGTSEPITLNEYFYHLKNMTAGEKVKFEEVQSSDLNFFSIEELQNDTGFKPSTDRFNLIEKNIPT